MEKELNILDLLNLAVKGILWLWHPVIGVLVLLLGQVEVAWGVCLFFGFIIYEITEAKVVKDKACWDIRDMIIGFAAYGFYLYVKKTVGW